MPDSHLALSKISFANRNKVAIALILGFLIILAIALTATPLKAQSEPVSSSPVSSVK